MSRISLVHVSPNASFQHREIFRIVDLKFGSAGLQLKRFLWLINAHDQLISFPEICSNTSAIIKSCETAWDIQDPIISELLKVIPILDWISDNRKLLADKIGPDFDRQPTRVKDHPIMSRGSSRHPLYTTLWNHHEDESSRNDYGLLQGHLLVAFAGELLHAENQTNYENYDSLREWKGTANSPYPACLAVRELSEAQHIPLIRQLAVRNSPKDFAKSLNRLPEIRSKVLLDRVDDLRRFLQKHHGIEDWVIRSQSKIKGTPGGGSLKVTGYVEISPQLIKVDLPLGDSGSPLDDCGITSLVSEIGISHSEQVERLESDLAPDEIDQQEMILTEFDQNQTGTVAANAGAQLRHIAMANQFFPWSYQQLSLAELSDALSKTMDWIDANVKGKKPHIIASAKTLERLELICLMRFMIFTGSSFDRAQEAIIYLQNQPNQDIDLTYLYTDGQPGSWRIRAIHPDYKSQVVQDNGLDRARTDYFTLPDISHSGKILSFLVSTAKWYAMPLDPPLPEYKLVRRDSKKTREQLHDLLKELDPSGRLTEQKISTFLFNRILEVSQGDICAASIICGQAHPLARVRLFYSVYSVEALQKLYLSAVEGLSGQLLKARQSKITITSPSLPENPYSVGSRLCPNFEAAKDAVNNLKMGLLENRNSDVETKFHNLYVIWMIWHFLFATACRGIITPYLPVSEIDAQTGVGLLADKDDGTGYKARFIWIPPFVLKLMGNFEKYLGLFAKSCSFTVDGHDPFFVKQDPLKNKIYAEIVRPTTLQPVMNRFLPYPVNFHRRFMRTELLTRGCPSEVVDAWMGHWNFGEEPWGPYSSFSFLEYRATLEKYLVPLMQDLGLDGTVP